MTGHLTDEQWNLGQKFARAQTKDEASELLDALVAARIGSYTEQPSSDPTEVVRVLLTEHRPNVVTEEVGPDPLHWRTRIKCDGNTCDFYVEDKRYWTAAQSHTDHLTEVVAAFMSERAAAQHQRIAAQRDHFADLLAACPQGHDGHACCDCPALSEQDLRDQVAAVAAQWICNCGGPSPEGQHEMHCDSYYGDRLRGLLRLGDDLGLRMRDARIARDAVTAYADAVAENPAASAWDSATIANDAREWAQEHHR